MLFMCVWGRDTIFEVCILYMLGMFVKRSGNSSFSFLCGMALRLSDDVDDDNNVREIRLQISCQPE